MNRLLGKQPAVRDQRMAALHRVIDAALAPPPKDVNWRADLPGGGIPMLGNDRAGCCVWASFLHWLQIARSYMGEQVVPTTEECLAAYAAATGYDPDRPGTDNGTVVMGPGGAVEYWTKVGIVCAGKRNFLTSAVRVDHANLDRIRQALIFGPLLCGAQLTQADVDSDFMWSERAGASVGGHEFLVVGCETISTGKTYYDVVTWDGERRFDDAWALAALDEAVMPLNPAFFDAKGIDAASIGMDEVSKAMDILRST